MTTSLAIHWAIVVSFGIFSTLPIGSGDGDILGGVGGVVSDISTVGLNSIARLLNIGTDGECLLCGDNPKKCRAVPIFSYCFSKGVLESPQLLNMFDFSQMTPKEEEDALFLIAGQTLAEKGDKKPSKDSNVTTRYISSCVHSLSLPLMVRLYSVPVAKFLQNKGILNSDNACDLANQYVQDMKDAGNSINDMECDERAKAVALGLGYENFHTSLGVFTPANCFQMALTFGNDLLELPPALKGSPLLAPKTPVNDRISLSSLGKLKCKKPTTKFDKSFCNFNPPPVEKFVKCYTKAVLKSKSLTQAYDVQKLSVSDFKLAFISVALRCLVKVSAHNPVQSSQDIENAFSKLTATPPPKAMAQTWAKVIAKHLSTENKLQTVEDAEKLCHEYVKMSKKEFKPIITDDPKTKSIALLTVGRNFMMKQGAFTAEDGPQITSIFAMQWTCLANEASQ